MISDEVTTKKVANCELNKGKSMNSKDIYHIHEYIYLTNDWFPNSFITEKELYYVDTTHLIWCCKKALDKNHICCYDLCDNCFILLDEEKKKKSARETTSRRV